MRKMLVSLVFVLGLASPAWGAVVCGNAIEQNDVAPASATITVSYTTPDPCVDCTTFVGATSRGSATINSATHAGNAMTGIAAEATVSPIHTRAFRIVNPTSGTNDVVVTFSGTPLAEAIVISTCSGTNTAAPIHDATNATGTGTAITVTVPNLVAGDVVIDMFGTDVATSDPTEGANQTVLHKGNDGAELGYGSSQQAAADGGVMSWTTALSQEWAQQAFAVSPAAAASILQAPSLPMFLFE